MGYPVPGEILTCRSSPMARLVAAAQAYAAGNSPILVRGETGVGKQRVAEYVHQCSPVGSKPFVRLDCTLPPPVLHAELNRAIGSTRGGTLFFDRVEHMPHELLEGALGSASHYAFASQAMTSCRFMASSECDLGTLVESSTMVDRNARYLTACVLHVPPLRERRADIPQLARFVLEEASNDMILSSRRISATALDALRSYRWPGNIRELDDALRHALVVADEDDRAIDLADLPLEVRSALHDTEEGQAVTLAEVEREHILRVLERCGGNRKMTAERLDIGINTLWRKLAAYGVGRRRGLNSSGAQS